MCIHIKGLCNKNIAILQYYQYVSVFTVSPKHHFVSPYISVLHFHHIKWYIYIWAKYNQKWLLSHANR